MPDPDVKRFMEGLNNTHPGLSLRMATHEGRVAIAQISRLRQLGGKAGVIAAIDSWRRTYIKACNSAAASIDQLWERHAWPHDGARAREYEWHPREDYQRWLNQHYRARRDLKRPE